MRQWIPLWVIPTLIIMAIGTVWVRLAVVRTAYAINQSNRMIANLQQEREQMELKVAGLRSPKRLELLAKSKFGLAQPRADQMIYLSAPTARTRGK